MAENGDLLLKIFDYVQASKPRAEIKCEIYPEYRNMRYWLEEAMTPVAKARDAVKALSIRTVLVPVRGSTDGSQLTELRGVTPSLFTGTQNFHHPLEWISVQDMVQTT